MKAIQEDSARNSFKFIEKFLNGIEKIFLKISSYQ